jgi:hypothetical protein
MRSYDRPRRLEVGLSGQRLAWRRRRRSWKQLVRSALPRMDWGVLG